MNNVLTVLNVMLRTAVEWDLIDKALVWMGCTVTAISTCCSSRSLAHPRRTGATRGRVDGTVGLVRTRGALP